MANALEVDETLSPEEKTIVEDLVKEGDEMREVDAHKTKPQTKETEKTEKIEEDKDKVVDRIAETDNEEKEKTERTPKMMPIWKQKIAEKKWEEEKNELLSTVSTLKEEMETIKQQSLSGKTEIATDSIKKLSEKYELSEDLVKDLILAVAEHAKPKEFNEIMEKVKGLEQLNLESLEEQKYNSDFDKKVIPAIQKEYPNISDKNLAKIKNDLHNIAYTEEYAKTPLDVIYKGLDDFRNVTIISRKSGEVTKSGITSKGGVIDYANITDEEFQALPRDKQEEAQKFLAEQG